MTTTTGLGFGRGFDERQPVIVLLDTSASMNRPAHSPRIAELNRALAGWFDSVRSKPQLLARVEVCLIAFDERVRIYDAVAGGFRAPQQADGDAVFAPLAGLRPPELPAAGCSCLVPAVRLALELAQRRRQELTDRGLPVVRPVIWLLTDGAPSDEWGTALDAGQLASTAAELRQAEQEDGCAFFVVGVRGADQELLKVLAPWSTHMLENLDFSQILSLLLASSDRLEPGRTIKETYTDVAHDADRARILNELEEDYL